MIRTKSGGRIDKWVTIFKSQREACYSQKSQVIPFDEWPDEFFPTNCWGVVYIMSQYVRNKLIQVENHWFDITARIQARTIRTNMLGIAYTFH